MASRRESELPDVPTTVEAGFPKAQTNIWYGLLGPRGLPQPIVDLLYQNVQAAIKRPETRERLAGVNVDAVGSSPTEYAAFIGEERARWGAVIRNAKIEAGPSQ
jgi:tripartite-type tricarboxylate transporter receptor subunit TctC